MKIYLDQDVYTAAKERISFVFDNYEEVWVSVSGGKDSTVVYELAIEEARKRNRLPVKVLWLDQEAEWAATREYMDYVMRRPDFSKKTPTCLPFPLACKILH